MINVVFEDIALYEIYTTGSTRDRKYKKLRKDARLMANIQETITINLLELTDHYASI